MKRLILLVLLSTLAACVPPGPPAPFPTPPSQAGDRFVQVTVRGGTSPVVTLLTDDNRTVPCPLAGGITRAVCLVNPATPAPFGAHLSVKAEGYQDVWINFLLTGIDNQDLPDVIMTPTVPPLSRVRMDGRFGLVDADGRRVLGTSVTGFQLVEMMAHGRQGEAARFLDSIRPARFVRVLLMAANLFQLPPADGIAALPATLQLAQQKGVYLEVVALADTRSYPGMDYRAHLAQVNTICLQSPACGVVELGNELAPVHQTQDQALGGLELLKSLRTQLAASIPVSLGSTHADMDESDVMRDGDYLTVHGARDDGDNGWRWVRHTNEQRALADRVSRYVWNDEPRRDDLDCGRQIGVAMLARIFSLGDTFHFRSGLFALPPDGGEATAFGCRVRGWQAVPEGWTGQYLNAGFAGSPVKSATGAVRIYSSVNGGAALVLVLGASPGLLVDWADGWTSRTKLVDESGAQLWSVRR